MKKYDVIVIGDNLTAITVAVTLSGFSNKVAIIKRDNGNEFICRKYVEFNALREVANVANTIRRAEEFGINMFSSVQEINTKKYVDQTVNKILEYAQNDNLNHLDIDVYKSDFEILNKHEIRVRSNVIRARKIVVAAYEKPEDYKIHNETGKKIVILSSRPKALEFAQIYKRLGNEVTVISDDKILHKEEEYISNKVYLDFEKEKIDIYEYVKVEKVVNGTVYFADKEIDYDYIISFDNYRLNKEIFKNLKIKYTNGGLYKDKYLRSSIKNIYILDSEFENYRDDNMPDYRGTVIAKNVEFPKKTRLDKLAKFYTIDIKPRIAHYGMTEKQIIEKRVKRNIRSIDYKYSELDKTKMNLNIEGYIKIIYNTRGKIFGVHVYGPGAEEIINMFKLIIDKKIKLKNIEKEVFIYPSYSDIVKKICVKLHVENLKERVLVRIMTKQ